MTKAELIDNVVKELSSNDLTKSLTEKVIDETFDQIKQALIKEGRFSYPGFGTFNVKDRAARKGRNPQTNEEIDIPASRTVGFKPAPRFKETL